jgi:hypothetical protein
MFVDSIETEEPHIPESDINEEDFDVVGVQGYFTDDFDHDGPTKHGQYPCMFGN